jgi:hypothetical protein
MTDSPTVFKRQDHIAQISPEINVRMQDAASLFGEVAEMFASLPSSPEDQAKGVSTFAKEIQFFRDRAAKCSEITSWYDPSKKKKAKVDKIRAMLAKLEAELAAGNGG